MPTPKIVQSPTAVRNYTHTWSEKTYPGLEITTSTWTPRDNGAATADLVIEDDTFEAMSVSWRMSCGIGVESGRRFLLTNHVVFDDGQEDDQVFIVEIESGAG